MHQNTIERTSVTPWSLKRLVWDNKKVYQPFLNCEPLTKVYMDERVHNTLGKWDGRLSKPRNRGHVYDPLQEL